MIPEKLFLTAGYGVDEHKLKSFEAALRDAGIAKCNLVEVSSIFPPGCEIVTRREGISELNPGEITYCVLCKNSTNEKGKRVTASVGLAIPTDRSEYGYLSEHASSMEKEASSAHSEDLAATMLAETLGVDFDPKENWDNRKKAYLMSNRMVPSRSITESKVNDDGKWNTVVSAAVFVCDKK